MFYCDNCKKNVETTIKDYKYEFNIGKEQHYVIEKQRYCNNCNSKIYDKELDNKLLKSIFRKKEELLGIEPEKIIELRKKYSLSQSSFSRLIGCAKKTLISYEKGTSIPNDIYLITLKMLIENPEIIYYYLKASENKFTKKEIDNIYERLEKNIKISQALSIYNGYSELNIDKLISIISILSKEKILKTKLLKELFYIDFIYFKNSVVSLTGLKYLKYQYGPVPENYENILNNLVKEKFITMNIEYKDNYESHYIKSKKVIENNLDKLELKIVNEVKEYFKDYSVSDIVEYSHKEKAFIETKNNKYIDYNLAFELNDF